MTYFHFNYTSNQIYFQSILKCHRNHSDFNLAFEIWQTLIYKYRFWVKGIIGFTVKINYKLLVLSLNVYMCISMSYSSKNTNLSMFTIEAFPYYSTVCQVLYSWLVFCKSITSIISLFTVNYSISSHGHSVLTHNWQLNE